MYKVLREVLKNISIGFVNGGGSGQEGLGEEEIAVIAEEVFGQRGGGLREEEIVVLSSFLLSLWLL